MRQLNAGTNVGESLLTLLNRESSNPIQGVVIVSDGRSNLGSDSSVEELRAKARKDKIPVFSVQVGEDRQPINIRITDVQTPEQTPPDEKFVVRVEIDGEGLPDGTKVFLTSTSPRISGTRWNRRISSRVNRHIRQGSTLDPSNADEEGRREQGMVEGEWKFVACPRRRGDLAAGARR